MLIEKFLIEIACPQSPDLKPLGKLGRASCRNSGFWITNINSQQQEDMLIDRSVGHFLWAYRQALVTTAPHRHDYALAESAKLETPATQHSIEKITECYFL